MRLLLTTVAAWLVAAPSALAADGIGLWGRADDKVVTFWGLGVVLFFPLLVTVLSLIQGRLERRKEERKAGLSRLQG